MAILNPRYKGLRKKKSNQPTDYSDFSALMIDGLTPEVVARFYAIPDRSSEHGYGSDPKDILVYLLDIADLVERYGPSRE